LNEKKNAFGTSSSEPQVTKRVSSGSEVEVVLQQDSIFHPRSALHNCSKKKEMKVFRPSVFKSAAEIPPKQP
jgi:hypothetical protein